MVFGLIIFFKSVLTLFQKEFIVLSTEKYEE